MQYKELNSITCEALLVILELLELPFLQQGDDKITTSPHIILFEDVLFLGPQISLSNKAFYAVEGQSIEVSSCLTIIFDLSENKNSVAFISAVADMQ